MCEKGKWGWLMVFAVLAVFSLQAGRVEAAGNGDYAGSYVGQFIGEDYGMLSLELDGNGSIMGKGKSTKYEMVLEFSGSVQPDGTFQFTTAGDAMIFAGSIDFLGRGSGKWAKPDGTRGSFNFVLQQARESLPQAAPKPQVVLQPAGANFQGQYVGQFIGEDYGLISLKIDEKGLILGTGKSTKYEVALEFSGSVQPDGAMEFFTADGGMAFSGVIDWMNRVGGKWTKKDGTSGSFNCILQSSK